MSLQEIIKKLQNSKTRKLLQKKSIGHLWIFGSRAKNTNTDDSDVDLLYELNESISQNWFEFFWAMADIKEKLGLSIDMVSIHHIHPDIKKEVLSSKIQIW